MARTTTILTDIDFVEPKKMFGGLVFMVNGHMCCGVIKDEIMVRVGPKRYEDALNKPYARKMDFTGKPFKGSVYVGCDGFESDEDLLMWVEMGLHFVLSMPPK